MTPEPDRPKIVVARDALALPDVIKDYANKVAMHILEEHNLAPIKGTLLDGTRELLIGIEKARGNSITIQPNAIDMAVRARSLINELDAERKSNTDLHLAFIGLLDRYFLTTDTSTLAARVFNVAVDQLGDGAKTSSQLNLKALFSGPEHKIKKAIRARVMTAFVGSIPNHPLALTLDEMPDGDIKILAVRSFPLPPAYVTYSLGN